MNMPLQQVYYVEYSYIIKKKIGKHFDWKRTHFLDVIKALWFESSRIVITFNKSKSSSLFSLVDVDFRPSHIICCVFSIFIIFFSSILLFFVMVFHNKPVSKLRLLNMEWRQSLRLKSLMEEIMVMIKIWEKEG